MKATLKKFLKSTVGGSRGALVVFHLLDDLMTGLSVRLGRGVNLGATHIEMNLDESLGYITQVYQDYLTYGGLKPEDLMGKRVLELGPGDSFGVALAFLSAGAEQVVCQDRFAPRRDTAHHQQVYAAQREKLLGEERARFDAAFLPDGRFNGKKLLALVGEPFEAAGARLEAASFDLIVSRAVLEHVADLPAAYAQMHRLLRPGGLMLHKVDFRDHGMFTALGQHPLTFLTVPPGLYQHLVRYSGKPNRQLLSEHRRLLQGLGFETRFFITHVINHDKEVLPHQPALRLGVDFTEADLEQVQQIRPRLATPFRPLPDEELLVSGVFMVAKKPGA